MFWPKPTIFHPYKSNQSLLDKVDGNTNSLLDNHSYLSRSLCPSLKSYFGPGHKPPPRLPTPNLEVPKSYGKSKYRFYEVAIQQSPNEKRAFRRSISCAIVTSRTLYQDRGWHLLSTYLNILFSILMECRFISVRLEYRISTEHLHKQVLEITITKVWEERTNRLKSWQPSVLHWSWRQQRQ